MTPAAALFLARQDFTERCWLTFVIKHDDHRACGTALATLTFRDSRIETGKTTKEQHIFFHLDRNDGARPVTKRVADYGSTWSKPISNLIRALRRPPYTWAVFARRAYVLTWPISAIFRGLAIVVLLVVFVVAGTAGTIAYRLACIWHGAAPL